MEIPVLFESAVISRNQFTYSTPDEIREVFRYAKLQHFTKDQFVYRDIDPPEDFFLIIEGEVELFKYSPERQIRITLSILSRGLFIGIPELFEQQYFLNAVALTDCIIALISKNDFIHHLSKLSGFMMDLVKMEAHIITQLQKTLIIDNADNRIANYLCWLSKETGKAEDGRIYIPRKISFEKMGNILFLTRETVSRLFAGLKKKKIIDYNSDYFIILDFEKLKSLSNTDDILTGYYGSC